MRRWDKVSDEFKRQIVELGGKFCTQKELAKLLGIPPGTISSFRLRNGVPMPVEKLPLHGPVFAQFSNLLVQYKSKGRVTSGPRFKIPPQVAQPGPTLRPALRVLDNPTPPPTAEEKDEEKERRFISLVLGTWEPKNSERPFNRLPRPEQRKVQHDAQRFLDYRAHIKELRL